MAVELLKRPVDEGAVRMLEGFLEDARAGRIRNLLVIADTDDQTVQSGMSFEDSERLLSFLVRLQFRILKATTGG